MIRSCGLMAWVTVVVLGLGSVAADGQQPAPSGAEFPAKAELLRRIALYEDAERNAEHTHPGMESMVKLYSNLAGLYEDVAMYAQSEDQMRREIALLRSGAQDELADAFGHLAVLHIAMGNLHQAEKDDLEALNIRESLGDELGPAVTWTDLADIYVREKQFKKALDYARKAMAVLADSPGASAVDQIATRQALGSALCGMKQCGQAIPILMDAVELEKRTYGADSLIVGTGTYLLGHAYWQNGEMDKAAELMERGAGRMKVDLGWGQKIYLNAMTEYAKFLRQRGQYDAAASAEREVRQAQSVVDARTLTPSTTAFVAAGPQR